MKESTAKSPHPAVSLALAMSRFLLCVSAVSAILLIAGCTQAPAAWTVSPDVMAMASESHSIVWGVITLQNVRNFDSGVTDIYIPGLLSFKPGPSAKLVFRDEASTRKFAAEAHGRMSEFFACALPEGEYRLTVDATWPDMLRWVAVSNKTVRCSGNGQAVFVGYLGMGILQGRTFLYYATPEVRRSFDGEIKKFLADNPEFRGEVEQQILAPGVVLEKQ